MRYHDPEKQNEYQERLSSRDEKILARWFDGATRAELSKEFDLSPGRISVIVNREASADYHLVGNVFVNINAK